MPQSVTTARRKSAHALSRCCFLLLLFSLLCPRVLAEDTPTFKFAPPDGMTYIETERTKSTTEFVAGETRKKTVQLQISKTRKEIHTTVDGYTLTETLFAVKNIMDGKIIDADLTSRVRMNIPITCHIDKDGNLLAIDGIEKIIQSSKDIIPPDKLRLSGDLFTAKGITDRYQSSWKETRSIIGRMVKSGNSWEISSNETLLDGSKGISNMTVTIGAREVINGREGVHLHFTEHVDKDMMVNLHRYFCHRLLARQGGARWEITVTQATHESDEVLDPNTMQLLTDSSSYLSVDELSVRMVIPASSPCNLRVKPLWIIILL